LNAEHFFKKEGKMKRGEEVCSMIGLLIISVLLFLGSPVEGAELCVHASGGDCYTSLQTAIAAASSGDTIIVKHGEYIETGQIWISKSLTIRGEGFPVIKPSGNQTSWWSVTSSNINLNLSNLILDGGGYYVQTAIDVWGTGTIDRCEIRNIIDSMNLGVAIIVWGKWTITNNTFRNIGVYGISLASNASESVIDHNIYHGRGSAAMQEIGITITKATAVVTNNIITNCRNDANTYVLSGGIFITDSPSVIVTDNVFSDNEVGMVIENGGGYGSIDSTVEAHYNYLCNESYKAIWTNNSTITVNLENNIWCTTDPDEIESMLSDPFAMVDFDPWSKIGAKGEQGPAGAQGPAGSPDTQIDILNKIAQQTDGAVLNMQQGVSEDDKVGKVLVKDKAAKTQFEVTNDGTVTLGNETADAGGKLMVKQGLAEDDAVGKVTVQDKVGKAKFEVTGDGTVKIGNTTAPQGGQLIVQQGSAEDDKKAKVLVKDKANRTVFQVTSDGTLIIGGN
jgi:hypothetical protein